MNQGTEQKITRHLEMSSPDDLRPTARTVVEAEIKRVKIPFPELNWLMHQVVGADYRWGGREDWGRQEWTDYVDSSELETWIAYVSGTPAGYYELRKQEDGAVRIECFGLRKDFFGQGLGGSLLTHAVKRSWEIGANRVLLNTCTQDHPLALSNYLARGFEIVKETTGEPNAPFQSGLFGS